MPNLEGAFFSRARAGRRLDFAHAGTAKEHSREHSAEDGRRRHLPIGGGEPAGVYPPPAGAEAARRAARRDGGAGGRGAGGSDARRPLRGISERGILYEPMG
jgi:hypothetical protein